MGVPELVLPAVGMLMMYADIAMYKVINGKFGGYVSSWKKEFKKLI